MLRVREYNPPVAMRLMRIKRTDGKNVRRLRPYLIRLTIAARLAAII